MADDRYCIIFSINHSLETKHRDKEEIKKIPEPLSSQALF